MNSYTNVILTIIAVALVGLLLSNLFGLSYTVALSDQTLTKLYWKLNGLEVDVTNTIDAEITNTVDVCEVCQ